MKRGFELLTKKNTTFNIAELEQQYNVTLPPLFKLFLNYFDICGNYSVMFDKVLLKSNYEIYFRSIAFKPQMYGGTFPLKLGLFPIVPEDYAMSLPQLFKSFHDDRYEPEWAEYGMYRIFTVMYGGIFVGTRAGEEDAIFRVLWEMGDGLPEKIANNIFEFINELEELPMEEEFFEHYGFQLNQLYKNWGEDFWRIREE
jgi:hypothetical protein